MFDLVDLQPMVLPEGSGLRRAPALREAARGPDFAERYDWDTLVYGAALTRRGLVLVCPRLLNLEALVRGGSFHSDAGPHRLLRIRRFRRHDELLLEAASAGPVLRFRAEGLELGCPVQLPWEGASGQRALVTTSKDNDPLWIADWAGHHVRNQGSRAVLIHDNLSSYGAGAVLEALRAVPGITAARVVSVPCRYGPMARRKPRGKGKFLQSGLLNLARHGALSGAASVLQCDIDELAMSDPGAPTLHEAAETGWLGYATARAYWRGRGGTDGQLPRHGDHVLSWTPERTTKEKWCLRPSGPLGGLSWDVHGVGRYLFNALAMRRDIRFYHCEGLSTDWKRPRSGQVGAGAAPDPATRAAMERSGLRPKGDQPPG